MCYISLRLGENVYQVVEQLDIHLIQLHCYTLQHVDIKRHDFVILIVELKSNQVIERLV